MRSKELEIIDREIAIELQQRVSPNFTNRVMGEIERVERRHTLLFNFVVVSGVAAALIVAFFLSSSYLSPPTSTTTLTLNDTQIESLYLYNFEE
ncbi:MAG: hypothetical protein WC960_04835 [Bacteroidales bacterium]